MAPTSGLGVGVAAAGLGGQVLPSSSRDTILTVELSYDAGQFWTGVLGVVVTAAAAVLAAYLQVRPAHTRLTWGMPSSTALLSSAVAKVRVLHEDDELVAPFVVKLRLASTGRHSIRSSHFDGDQPLRIGLDARPVAVLSRHASPPEYAAPELRLSDREVHVLPSLIYRGQVIEYELLVDGAPELSMLSPLADVKLKRDDRTADQSPGAFTKRVFTWAGIAFLLFFIAYRPDSAADVFQALGATTADIGQWLGQWVTSIVV